MDRTNNKLKKWLKGLDRNQQNLLTEYCMEQSRSDLMGYFNAYERVIRPVLFDVTKDINETEKILQRIVYEVGEEGINLHRFENGSVEYMKKIEDSRKEIIKKYEEMKGSGAQEKDIYIDLKAAFPKLTANAIKNTVLEYKRDLKKMQVLETGSTEDAVDYIFDEGAKETQNKADIKAEKEGQPIAPKEENEGDSKEIQATGNKLKVVKKEIELQGEFGTYKVNSDTASSCASSTSASRRPSALTSAPGTSSRASSTVSPGSNRIPSAEPTSTSRIGRGRDRSAWSRWIFPGSSRRR
jgi:hypothetical protein